MKYTKRIVALLLAAAMVLSFCHTSECEVQAAGKSVASWNKKTLTLTVGKTITLQLKKSERNKKVTWSSSRKKIAAMENGIRVLERN